jgi:CrcB protein
MTFTIYSVILVALGGAVGSSARYLLGEIITSFSRGQIFPLSTIAVNVLGSFLAGILHFVFVNYMESLSLNVRLVIMTGFLGGFTTFSTFSLDALRLLNAGQIGVAASYIILSVILSILAIFFGFYISSLIAN